MVKIIAKPSLVRFWELDFWRGIADILMIFYHATFTWLAMTGDGFVMPLMQYQIVARLASTSFLLLVGISAYISAERRLTNGQSWRQIEYHFYTRGAIIFGWGLIISVLSYLFVPNATIIFGILHFIGMTLLFMPFMLQLRPIRLLFVLISAIAVAYTFVVGTENIPRFFTGFLFQQFSTLDYWPFFPWVLIVIIGIEAGKYFYKNGKRRFKMPLVNMNKGFTSILIKSLSYVGKHALVIYLIHFPILYCLIWMVSRLF